MSWDFGSTGSGGQSGHPQSPSDAPWPSATTPTSASAPMPPSAPATPAGGRSGGSAPTIWLSAGLLVAIVAIILGLLGDVWLAVAGWALGGPVAIGLFAVFVTVDGRRRSDPWYAATAVADVGRRLLVLACLVAVAVNAWHVADHVSRSGWFG